METEKTAIELAIKSIIEDNFEFLKELIDRGILEMNTLVNVYYESKDLLELAFINKSIRCFDYLSYTKLGEFREDLVTQRGEILPQPHHKFKLSINNFKKVSSL